MALKHKTQDVEKAAAAHREPEQETAQPSNEHERPTNPALLLKRATGAHAASLRPADILGLQRTIGNRAVGRILASQPNALPPQASNTVQRKTEEGEPLQAKLGTDSKAENKTGLPANLKAGIERLSGLAMDDVRVHYNSSEPARVQALAYTQGINIHVGPNQERHLPHEAWHVVQQKQGRVKPTLQAKGVAINDDQALEREAGELGARALQTNSAPVSGLTGNGSISSANSTDAPAQRVIQRVIGYATPGNPGGKAQLDIDLAANTKDVVRFTHGESLSKSWGVASKTKSFTNANGSDKLQNQRITWGAKVIGTLRPIGKMGGPGNFVPGVKLHLVNSFLHAKANSWPENWVWGHGDLNKAHEKNIESVAKTKHPKSGKQLASGKPIYALSYRTEVTSKAAAAAKTADNIADEIAAAINAYKPIGWTGATRASVKAQVKIGGQDIPTYHGQWQTAIPNTVARKLESFGRIYGVDAQGDVEAEDVVLGPGSVELADAVEYRIIVGDLGLWFAGNGVFTPPPPPPPPPSGNKRPFGGGGGSGGGGTSGTASNKKIKTG